MYHINLLKKWYSKSENHEEQTNTHELIDGDDGDITEETPPKRSLWEAAYIDTTEAVAGRTL